MGKPGKPGVVGRNLKRLMEEKNIGATELARRAGLPRRSTVTSILDGSTRDPQTETVAKIADALGVPVTTLTSDRQPDVEALIAAFRKDRKSASLDPPFNERDAAHLREEGRYMLGDDKPAKPKAILLLVRFLREKHGDEDRSG